MSIFLSHVQFFVDQDFTVIIIISFQVRPSAHTYICTHTHTHIHIHTYMLRGQVILLKKTHIILTAAHSVLQTCVFSSFLTAPSGPFTQLKFLQGSPTGESQLSPS
jgi:hypothetical protein